MSNSIYIFGWKKIKQMRKKSEFHLNSILVRSGNYHPYMWSLYPISCDLFLSTTNSYIFSEPSHAHTQTEKWLMCTCLLWIFSGLICSFFYQLCWSHFHFIGHIITTMWRRLGIGHLYLVVENSRCTVQWSTLNNYRKIVHQLSP